MESEALLKGVLVTHPGRQHSHQAAVALSRAGLLAGYWSGVPASEERLGRIPTWARRRFVRYSAVAISADLTRTVPWVPAMRRLGDALLPATLAARSDFAACRMFDCCVARRLERARPAAVLACELSALSTFKAAKQRGVVTVLDAPSIHHMAQDRSHGFSEPVQLHRKKAAVKDEEIDLADHIVVVSELARRTYREAGVPAERLHAVPLGVDIELFSAGRDSGRRHGQSFTFVFAGATIHRKGVDLLVDAFTRGDASMADAKLVVVGPVGDSERELKRLAPTRLERVGRVTQQELAELLWRCDCLVLPSRNDSFGMVVAEALAAGCPVIVSDMVGAKDLVTPGANGWVVPVDDAATLAARLRWCVTHRTELAAMRPACEESARRATWTAYHERVVEMFRSILAGKAA